MTKQQLTVNQVLKLAGDYIRAGNLREGERLYLQIVEQKPQEVVAIYNLGACLLMQGRVKEALPWLERAYKLNRQDSDVAHALMVCHAKLNDSEQATLVRKKANHAWPNDVRFQPETHQASLPESLRKALSDLFNQCHGLYSQGDYVALEKAGLGWVERFPKQAGRGWDFVGLARLQSGQAATAETAFHNAVMLEEGDAELWDHLGTALNKQGKWSEAEAAFAKALALDSSSPHLLSNAAGNLSDNNKHEAAMKLLQRALKIKPDYHRAILNMGNALIGLGRMDEAIEEFREVTRLAPEWPAGWNNLGNALKQRGRLQEAVSALQRALQLRPDFIEALNNLGAIYKLTQQPEQAMACFKRAIELSPNFADTYINLGSLLHGVGRQLSAVEALSRAQQLKPDEPLVYMNLGYCLQDLGRFDEAVEAYRRCVALKPDLEDAFSNFLFCLNYHPTLSAEEIFKVYAEYNERFALLPNPSSVEHKNSRDPLRRLKVGYVTPDLRMHSVRFFLEPLLAHHDHTKFEIYAYAELVNPDAMTERYRSYFDHWRDTLGVSDHELAEQIRRDEIDILIDLAGHSGHNRLQTFSLKPAPIQVSWWIGFACTTGLKAIDYFLADEHLVPQGYEHLLSEQPWRLSRPALVYRPSPDFPPSSELPAKKNGYVTFGTLSRSVRLNDRLVKVWSELLKRIPMARLVINSGDFKTEEMQQWMLAKFKACGIEPERLSVGFDTPAWIPMQQIDIMLDCFPHNSGTTLFESLYAGIPVVSLADRPTGGRVGAHVLASVGRLEWLADSEEQYLEITTTLASDINQLSEIRASLPDQMRRSLALDEAGFCVDFEEALLKMWGNYCQRGRA